MGGSKAQTVGYWYRPVIQLGLHQGPFDALLRIRGGDVDAWQGEMTSSGSLYVYAPEIWGGEDSEGGMIGSVDVMFGEADQQPNSYFQTAIGPDPSGHRGLATLLWKGGRYGAMNPYPKPLAVMTRRVVKGWDRDVCWYPETAPIAMALSPFAALYFAVDLSGSMATVASNGKTRLENMKSALLAALELLAEGAAAGSAIDVMIVGFGTFPAGRASIVRRSVGAASVQELKTWVSGLGTAFGTYFPAGTMDLEGFFAASSNRARRVAFLVTDGEPVDAGSGMSPGQIAEAAAVHVRAVQGLTCYGINIDMADTQYTAIVANAPEGVAVVDGGNPAALTSIIARAVFGGLIAMNAAHAIYDSLVDPRMQGEPVGLINDASFRAAADKLFAERFGICTFYDPDQETVEQFRQRLCDLIGAQCSRSTVDGQWYLDLIRGDYDIAQLPVLTDDDILEFQDDPSVLDDAVNQVAVQWFDPLTKQERITAPVHSLGAVQAMGSIVAETNRFLEIPVESLADRVAARDLRNKSTPLWRKTLKTNRTPYAWRIGTQFRLQAPRHGVADMVCMVGEIDKGTLRSGAISMIALQDIFAMPESTYVVGQPTVPPEDRTPLPAVAQRVFEAPYVELVGALPAAELQAMEPTSGYLQVVGARPEGSVSYQLQVSADGDTYTESGSYDWTPTAIVTAAADAFTEAVSLASPLLLDRVAAGSAALWGDEIVRVDAIDLETLTLIIGRGCADTVPAPHGAGSRIWFYDAWSGSDAQAYIESEQVSAKLLTRMRGGILGLGDAPASTVSFAARAARPYPPANVQLNGEPYAPIVSVDLHFTWSHRDRLLQSDQLIDNTQPSVGPEPGTTYTLELVSGASGAVVYELADIEGDSVTVPIADVQSSRVMARLFSVRDGLRSWQAVEWEIELVFDPLNFEFDGAPYTPPAGDGVDFVF